ncbi:MAG: zinc ribbon domain-containing protein [Oscillospiraceae bacterium]
MAIKDKIDQLGQKFGGAVAKAQDTTKTFAEKTKLKSKISAEKDKINKIYASIGKKYCELFAENPAEDFAGFIAEINASNELIKSYNVQLAALDDTIYCTNCGNQISKDSEFCSKCGAKQEIPVVEEVEVVTPAETVNDEKPQE